MGTAQESLNSLIKIVENDDKERFHQMFMPLNPCSDTKKESARKEALTNFFDEFKERQPHIDEFRNAKFQPFGECIFFFVEGRRSHFILKKNESGHWKVVNWGHDHCWQTHLGDADKSGLDSRHMPPSDP
jgi:hypothetical protein